MLVASEYETSFISLRSAHNCRVQGQGFHKLIISIHQNTKKDRLLDQYIYFNLIKTRKHKDDS